MLITYTDGWVNAPNWSPECDAEADKHLFDDNKKNSLSEKGFGKGFLGSVEKPTIWMVKCGRNRILPALTYSLINYAVFGWTKCVLIFHDEFRGMDGGFGEWLGFCVWLWGLKRRKYHWKYWRSFLNLTKIKFSSIQTEQQEWGVKVFKQLFSIDCRNVWNDPAIRDTRPRLPFFTLRFSCFGISRTNFIPCTIIKIRIHNIIA